ncbi:MAG: hypothetical protein E7509_07670 [Ruminococcus sp.]|nr:hypothetical protein [Ruminococcus sp.]
MRIIRNLLNDLIFWGYDKSEYAKKGQVELRGIRNAFETQIKTATIFSFIIIAIDIVALAMTVLQMPWNEFLKATSIHIEMLFVLVALGLTIASIFSKITSGILSAVYFAASVLLLIFGNAGSLFLCVLCAFGYLRIVFSHIHLEYVKKYLDSDDYAEIRQVIKGVGHMRDDVKKAFRDYQKGGVNPLNNQMNHEAVFEKPFEIDDDENNDEIHTEFSAEDLDALLGQCENPRMKFEIEGVNDSVVTEVED